MLTLPGLQPKFYDQVCRYFRTVAALRVVMLFLLVTVAHQVAAAADSAPSVSLIANGNM